MATLAICYHNLAKQYDKDSNYKNAYDNFKRSYQVLKEQLGSNDFLSKKFYYYLITYQKVNNFNIHIYILTYLFIYKLILFSF